MRCSKLQHVCQLARAQCAIGAGMQARMHQLAGSSSSCARAPPPQRTGPQISVPARLRRGRDRADSEAESWGAPSMRGMLRDQSHYATPAALASSLQQRALAGSPHTITTDRRDHPAAPHEAGMKWDTNKPHAPTRTHPASLAPRQPPPRLVSHPPSGPAHVPCVARCVLLSPTEPPTWSLICRRR